jgi:hypothetical protein
MSACLEADLDFISFLAFSAILDRRALPESDESESSDE